MVVRRTFPVYGLLLLAAVAAAPLFAGSLKSEVAWISELEGVTLSVSSEKSAHLENVYTITGSASGILTSIKVGLQERGWKLKAVGTASTATETMTGIEATKGGMELDLAVQSLGPLTSIALDLKGVSGSSATSSTSTTTATSTKSTVTAEKSVSTANAIKAGATLVINGNGQFKTYDCSGTVVILNGNENTITLLGTCSTLTVNGNGNRISVKAQIGDVVINGSSTTMKWWSDKNPTAPRVTDNGNDNNVSEVKE